MARTLTEILKEADAATDLQVLIRLWNEIAEDKYEYPLIELRFANEHIRELALKVDSCDLAKGHFYTVLNEMNKNQKTK